MELLKELLALNESTSKAQWSNVSKESSMNEAKNHLGDTEYKNFDSWKRAAKKKDSTVWFEGDKDIAQAMVGTKPFKKGETKSIGEWDGEVGSIYIN
jgi:hypothetical protein